MPIKMPVVSSLEDIHLPKNNRSFPGMNKDILSLFDITTKDVDRYLDTINKTTNIKTS